MFDQVDGIYVERMKRKCDLISTESLLFFPPPASTVPGKTVPSWPITFVIGIKYLRKFILNQFIV